MVSNEFSSTYTSSPNPPKNDSITVPSRVQNRTSVRARAKHSFCFSLKSHAQTHSSSILTLKLTLPASSPYLPS